ncbi:hypothetical protein HMI56_000749 [Coelomomyces lativittatus]|nr:hypothetical protein HMI56_000749 [Coelomomyces lativittatus]
MSCPFKPSSNSPGGTSSQSNLYKPGSLSIQVNDALSFIDNGGSKTSVARQGSSASLSDSGRPRSSSGASISNMSRSNDDAMNMEDPILNWQLSLNPGVRRIFENLRADMEKMETNIHKAENEVFRKVHNFFIFQGFFYTFFFKKKKKKKKHDLYSTDI